MPTVPLYGHELLRERLDLSVDGGMLPSSLLLHGPQGIGKQRLALWLAQRLVCTGGAPRPCGSCPHCRFATELTHPDIHWFFPRPRLKDSDPPFDDVLADYADAVAERARNHGLYTAASGSDAIYVATVRAIVRQAALSPAMAARKVFVIGEADRLVPQEGADAAANAFLKLLEEPLADTTFVLTTCEPGALLPTIRSRVVAVRVPPLPASEVAAFLRDPLVASTLGLAGDERAIAERARRAAGAPGRLFAGDDREDPADAAMHLLDAAVGRRAERYRAALVQSSTRARGGFASMLDELTTLLHARVREAVERMDPTDAASAARAMGCVERAKTAASGNVSPQLLSATLLRELSDTLAGRRP